MRLFYCLRMPPFKARMAGGMRLFYSLRITSRDPGVRTGCTRPATVEHGERVGLSSEGPCLAISFSAGAGIVG